MEVEIKLPSAALVKQFGEIEDFAKKCEFFKANQVLGRIFNSIHFTSVEPVIAKEIPAVVAPVAVESVNKQESK